MHISCLSNNVTQKESYDSLIKLCANNPDIFGSTAFLFEALKLLSVYSFKLSTRRFILFELFGSVTFTSKNIEMFDSDMTISLDNIPKHLPIPSKWAESKQNPLSTPGSKSLLKIPDTPSIGGSPETNKQLTSNRSSGNNDFVID